MRFRNFIFVIIVNLLFVGTASGAEKYEIDASHSSIGFAVRHMVINKARGGFTDFTGDVVYDEEDITKSSINITIKTASIDTNNEKRDDHLREPEFFDVKKYPEITFKSKRFKKRDSGTFVIGIFTMHGVSKEIEIPITFTGTVEVWGKTRLGIEAGLKLNRRDYGMSFSSTMDNGGLVIGNEVEIEINIEAVKK